MLKGAIMWVKASTIRASKFNVWVVIVLRAMIFGATVLRPNYLKVIVLRFRLVRCSGLMI